MLANLRAVAQGWSRIACTLQRLGDGWFIGLAARAVFASVLLVYFLNAALTKLGPGVSGLFLPKPGAYAQILPGLTASVGYNLSEIPFLPYGLIVLLGSWAEFALPVLVVLGLFTRLASLAFIFFIVVMSCVDIFGHKLDASTIGAPFDGDPAAMIADQRLLWCFLLIVLVLRGAGAVSLDRVIEKRLLSR